jgi:hypothetical protein
MQQLYFILAIFFCTFNNILKKFENLNYSI